MTVRNPFTLISNRLKLLTSSDFLYHGLGSLGEVKDHGDITAGVNLHSALYGMFHRMRLTGGTSFVFSNSLPEKNGAGWIIIDNSSGGDVTPTWPGHFEFGAAGEPTIPDGVVCTILTAYDYEGGVFRCVHNTTLGSPQLINPGASFSGNGAVLAGTIVVRKQVKQACEIIGWDLVGSGESGSGTVVVEKSSILTFPTFTSMFTASCTSAAKSNATGLSYALAKDDIVRFTGSGFATWNYCDLTTECLPA
jgi:hypothetical protein